MSKKKSTMKISKTTPLHFILNTLVLLFSTCYPRFTSPIILVIPLCQLFLSYLSNSSLPGLYLHFHRQRPTYLRQWFLPCFFASSKNSHSQDRTSIFSLWMSSHYTRLFPTTMVRKHLSSPLTNDANQIHQPQPSSSLLNWSSLPMCSHSTVGSTFKHLVLPWAVSLARVMLAFLVAIKSSS